jgi:hypothetical protein
MSSWKQIENEEMLQAFISEVDGFHDALLHEAVLLNTGYVDRDGLMYGDVDLPNARMIIQSQFADVIGVELDLKRVSAFSLVFDRDIQMEAEMLKDGIALYPCGKAGANRSLIRAEAISFRMLDIESRGPQFRLSSSIEPLDIPLR